MMTKLRHRIASTALLCALTASLLAGCVSVPRVTESDRARIRKVAIVVADTSPTIEIRIRTNTTETLARIQAAAEEEVRRRLSTADLRQPLIVALQAELAKSGFEVTVLAKAEAPKDAGSPPHYHARGKDFDAVLEVTIRALRMFGAGHNRIMTRGSNELLAGLGIGGQARLITIADQGVLQFSVSYFSGYLPLEDWMAERGKHIEEAIAAATRRMAADTVDRALRVYEPTSPSVESKGQGSVQQSWGERQVTAASAPDPKGLPHDDPDYSIHALRPLRLQPVGANPFRVQFGGRPIYGINLTPSKADAIRPTFEWERFPRSDDGAPEKTDSSRIASVTYELRLSNSVRRYVQGQADRLSAERVIYERAGLPAPIHQVESELDHCEVYFWTVRARFSLDGRDRVTPWMTYRRSTIAFATPPKPGQGCVYGN